MSTCMHVSLSLSLYIYIYKYRSINTDVTLFWIQKRLKIQAAWLFSICAVIAHAA